MLVLAWYSTVVVLKYMYCIICRVKVDIFWGLFTDYCNCLLLENLTILNVKNCFKIFFCLRGRFPSLPWVFYTLLHNDPAAHQDDCGTQEEKSNSNLGPLPQKSGALSIIHLRNHRGIYFLLVYQEAVGTSKYIWYHTVYEKQKLKTLHTAPLTTCEKYCSLTMLVHDLKRTFFGWTIQKNRQT